jgi:hypothetical protein
LVQIDTDLDPDPANWCRQSDRNRIHDTTSIPLLSNTSINKAIFATQREERLSEMKMGLGPRGENIQKNEKSKKRGEKTIFF